MCYSVSFFFSFFFLSERQELAEWHRTWGRGNASRYGPGSDYRNTAEASIVLGLDEGDVVSLRHDPPELLACVPLQVDLRGVVQHQVHVLVEPDNVTLNPGVNVLVELDRNPGPVLQVPEDQVDWLHHHLLDLLTTTVRHPECLKILLKKLI